MRRALLATIALLAAAPVARAEELRLGAHFESEYNSLVTTLGGDQDDVTFDFGPTLELSGEHGRLDYEFTHHSYYKKYATIDQLDDWSHETALRANWNALRHVRFSLQDRFTVRPQRSTRDADLEEETEILDRLGNNQVLTNSFSLTARVTPIPRLASTFQFSHLFRTVDQATINNQDTSSLTTRTTTTYELTKNHTLGGGFRFSRRLFKTSNLSQSSTDSFEAFGTWTWRIDERTTFSAQAGPNWASDDLGEASLPAVPRYAQVPGTNFLADASTCQFGIPIFVDLGFGLTLVGYDSILDGSCQPMLDDNGTPADPSDDFQIQVPFTAEQAAQNLALGPVQLSAFPAFLTSGIPGLQAFEDGAPNDSNVNLFFTLGLSRIIDHGRLFTSWSRSDSETQGLGSNTVLDSFIAGLVYDISARTNLTATFRYTRRKTDAKATAQIPIFFGPSSEVALGPPEDDPDMLVDTGLSGGVIIGAINQEQTFKQTDDIYSFDVFLSREMGRDWTMFSGATVRSQDSSFETGLTDGSRTQDQWEVRFGFNYRFRPIRL